jgi:hypothetical protein
MGIPVDISACPYRNALPNAIRHKERKKDPKRRMKFTLSRGIIGSRDNLK